MKTTPATAWHLPWVVLRRAWGLPLAVRDARLGNENSETATKEKQQKVINNNITTTTATARLLAWAVVVESLGAGGGPPRCQAWC